MSAPIDIPAKSRHARAPACGKPSAPLERETQAAIIAYCKAVLPAGSVVYAIPNASRRTRTGKASNAIPGLLRGVSDLCILAPGRVVIYAEVKRETGGSVSPEQFEFQQSVRALGHSAAIWRGIDDARNTFAALHIKTREVVAAVGEGGA